MELTRAELHRRIMGCWLGKAVGGTLGQTFEGLSGPLDADFYVPVPTQMVPNDDLDLQVLHACVLDRQDQPDVDRHVLARGWRDHVAFPWNEYGVGMRNLAEGLEPPYTGSFDNWFTCGEGAAIRSELWACLAAGDPDLAAAYAYEDACFDHAGDGIVAAQFLGRLQAAAFTESDPEVLLDGALAGIDTNSGIHRVVTDTRGWVSDHTASDGRVDWIAVRALIMERYGRSDFTDVRPNTGFVVLGWLAGRTFGERICITNNCGEDCDSSTASIGALLGILDPDSIEARWLAPIGRDLVLNPEITGIEPPPTLDGFTELVIDLSERLGGRAPTAISGDFDPAGRRLPVDLGWFNTTSGRWDIRDQTELPPPGSPVPLPVDGWTATDLPGTWVQRPRTDFADRILLLRYSLDGRGRHRVRLMFNCTEHFRIWLDGDYLFGAQGSQYMFPAPHMAPLGQAFDLDLNAGGHEVVVAVRRPPEHRPVAEWVIGAVELPSALWIPDALRPQPNPVL